MAEVKLEGVSHRYEGARAHTLENLDLSVASGGCHALLGSSGAGKTTLLNLLSGLELPSSGRILFDGEDVSKLDAGRRNVAQVFQFPVLYESLDVARNLEFPLKTRGMPRRDRQARAIEVAGRLGIEELLGRRARELSLFEKQLVAIGRALVRPDVALVLLDEPLTAVEPARKWQLRRVLKQAQQELGATMIYVTHDQTEALTFAEQISVLHQGEVVQTGSPTDLFERPASEYVAEFVGSTGMNLVPGEVREGSLLGHGHALGIRVAEAPGACTVGFRPEWARAISAGSDGPGVPAQVTDTRTQGVRQRRPVGVVRAKLGEREVSLRQALDVTTGDAVILQLDQLVAFRGGAYLQGWSRVEDGTYARA